MSLFELIGCFYVLFAAVIGTAFIVGAFICGALQIRNWIQIGRKWDETESHVQREVRRER